MGRIEKIKLRDFKSFRNAIIPFVDGFVTVVGPNGSGKSNILDAILFVLGEGSMKALRAGRVRDLVHHNSRTGTAEVTVVLRKGTEKFQITREIDKQGVSVYRINGKRATRSDVLELISSLGIPLEGYNMVLQGEITSFIKKSPLQRREIIDEISGVAEYEEKKEKALKELAKVEEKIKEANLIIHERKGYIGQLKKERDEAVRYKNYQKKYQLVRANLIKLGLEKTQSVFDEKSALLEEKKKELENLQKEMSDVSAGIARLQLDLEKINSEIISRGEKEHMEITKKIESTRTEIRYLQERFAENTKRIRSLEDSINSLKVEIARLEEELAKKKKSLSSLESELNKYNELVKKKEGDLENFRKGMEEKNLLMSSLVDKIDEFSNKINELQKEFYSLLSDANAAKERLSVLRMTLSRTSRESQTPEEKRIMEEIESLKKEVGTRKRNLLGIENELEALFAREKELNQEYSSLEREIDTLKEKYHSLQSRITTIRAITGNAASEAVLEASKRGELVGIVGRVEDLFEYPEEYSIAVQTAAGPRLNFIVTKDDISATNAVKWLKKKRIGRTSFIPLNRIKSGVSLDKSILDMPGVIGYLLDLVKFPDDLRPVFEYVFGDTLLVEDIDTARKVGFGRIRMVTLDGDLVESSGVVTGGYREGVFTLKDIRTRDELRASIEKLESKRDRILSELESLRKKMEEVRKRKSEAEVLLREKETQLASLESRVRDILESKERMEEERKKLEDEISQLEKTIREKEEKARKIREEISKLESMRSELKDKMNRPEVKEAASRLDKMQKELESLKAQRTDVEIRYKSLLSEIKVLEEMRLSEMKETLKSNEEELAKRKKEQEEIKQRIYDLEKKLNEMLKREEVISSELSELIERREAIQNEINSLVEKRGSLTRLLENKRREINEISVELARVETKLNDLKREWESLEIREFRDLGMPEDQLNEELESLRKKMAKLEPVNLKAIEAYEEALKELEDIEERAKKLEDEKAAVINLIDQIEKKKRDVFMKTFNEIRSRFQRVYREFTEDPDAYADLRLENEEDPFSGGLLLEVRPSGKAVKRIEALSGGEQTVVVLVFYFAIQEYKPSPFYVWDEVDSALDRLNSERLARFIKQRSKTSQFIVITHNAALIHEADQIVGVSMNKKLGSSVVEVDMRDYLGKQGD